MDCNEQRTVFNAITSRRSIRSYEARAVPREMIVKILEAGQWAPSPSNIQSWRFVVVQEPQQTESLKAVSPGFPGDAPAAVVICSDQADMPNGAEASKAIRAAQEAAMAAQNMLLMAHSLGLGSCAVASYSEGGIAAVLELPSHLRPFLLVALGFPAENPLPPERKDLSRITFWENYEGNDG